ncbi:MAG TPA: rhomboid family intramembrane serine protease [Candidatus Udaeobacter sp.]|nr:rhomboid family intramembrane serine protease [Candidatus Udaeobacter sp.]
MELNHIFLFLAVVSPLLVLARAWRPGGTSRGWRIAALVVLAITGLAWMFWRGAAGYIGGGAWFALLFLPAIGSRKMTELAARGDYKSARKLGAVLQVLHPSAELREQVRLFHHLESRQNHRAAVSSAPIEDEITQQARRPHFRHAPAVLTLILINAAAFLFEISFGDWNNPEVLHQIGALEPYAVVAQGEYWRLFTALFLHGGFAHLLFNVFALYVLGPPLERSIGAVRFTLCYLISGLASSAGVVLLTVIGLVQVTQLVGASGCIMGIVGAWAGFLLRHRHAPHAKQRLANIFMIIVIQTAFDLSTPQVSMAAHLCGLIAGFFLGLVLAPRPVASLGDPGRD